LRKWDVDKILKIHLGIPSSLGGSFQAGETIVNPFVPDIKPPSPLHIHTRLRGLLFQELQPTHSKDPRKV